MRLFQILVFTALLTHGSISLAQNDETGQPSTNTEEMTSTDQVSVDPVDTSEPLETYEDTNNPGVFISEGRKKEGSAASQKSSTPETIVFGEITAEPKLFNDGLVGKTQALYTTADLDQHALRIAAHCKPSNTSGRKGVAVVPIGEEFYVLPTKPAGLPPKPGADGDATIMGTDVNKNCVRDDLEHFIFETWGKEDQKTLRLHLYAYSIWLRFYLIENISDKSIQAVERQLLITGLCMDKMLGAAEFNRAETEIFALMHNTHERTMRYFKNEELLTGFDVDTEVQPGC